MQPSNNSAVHFFVFFCFFMMVRVIWLTPSHCKFDIRYTTLFINFVDCACQVEGLYLGWCGGDRSL